MDIVGIEPTTFRTHKTMRSERYTPKLNAQSTEIPSQKDTIWNTGIYSLLYKRREHSSLSGSWQVRQTQNSYWI